jgi:hypothetical protein
LGSKIKDLNKPKWIDGDPKISLDKMLSKSASIGYEKEVKRIHSA